MFKFIIYHLQQPNNHTFLAAMVQINLNSRTKYIWQQRCRAVICEKTLVLSNHYYEPWKKAAQSIV